MPITKKGQPITGAPLPRRTPYVLADQARTSAMAQRQVMQPDIPQQDSQLRVPAPTNPYYRANNQFEKDAMRYGGVPRQQSLRKMADPNYGAVGYDRGATKAKPGNPVISGYPTRGGRQLVGEINLPKGIKGVKRFATNADIFSPRVLHEAGYSRL